MEIPPGRPGNLTAEQEEKLRQLWARILRLCNVASDDKLALAMADASLAAAAAPSNQEKKSEVAEKSKKKKLAIFSRSKNSSSKDVASVSTESSSTATSVLPSGATTPLPPGSETDDKYGQTKHFMETLEKQSPESIRETIWSMVKHDHPDHLVLRFLRARKWDVEKALVMFISTMNWRFEDMKVDEVIMKEGELDPAEREDSEGSSEKEKALCRGFLLQMRMGKSFIHGVDKLGRPICVVRVKYHKAGDQAEESLERYTVYLIETARMVLAPPVDTATIVFDMTGFSIANMDYAPVKFMIKCFEANYPESLGAVLVHRAPWVFQGIWKIIRGWLDPVVASKITFTNNVEDLEAFIPKNHIMAELDGDEKWAYEYVEPVPGENDIMKDTATKDRLLQERAAVVQEFELQTMEWISNPGDEDVKEKRKALAEKLRKGYWELDPYVRARSIYDRIGMLNPGGKMVPYPEEAQAQAQAPLANGVSEKEAKKATTESKSEADDVD